MLPILIVDDEPHIARLIEMTLEPLGQPLVLACDGEQAADLLEKQQFDLVLLDPPYQAELLEAAIAHIARHDLLTPHGMMAAEHPADKTLPALSAPYRMGRTYRYGKIAVTIYHRDGEAEA